MPELERASLNLGKLNMQWLLSRLSFDPGHSYLALITTVFVAGLSLRKASKQDRQFSETLASIKIQIVFVHLA
jgi:hypothetical protein